jgi:hypothetical protein
MKKNSTSPAFIIIIAALLIGGALLLYKLRHVLIPSPSSQMSAIANPTKDIPNNLPASSEVILNPSELPKLINPPKNINSALLELFGEKTLLSLLLMGEFINHFVVTVDNLGGPLSSANKWPFQKVEGQFQTEVKAGKIIISQTNASRYQPYVNALISLDLKKAASFYFYFYPKFQATYESIGYPDKQFNQRFIEVLDLLIKTPEASEVTPVELMKIAGPYQFTQPWTHYQFETASYEQLAIGQKIMLRLGLKNQSIVKTKLKEFRNLIDRPVSQ